MILFSEPLNSGKEITIPPSDTGIPELKDMRRDTYYVHPTASTTAVNFNIKTSGGTFDCIYLIGTHIAQYDVLLGSIPVVEILPKQLVAGHIEPDGAIIQYGLYHFRPAHATDITLRINADGEDPFRLYLVYILNRQVHIPEDRNFTRIDMSAVDTNRVVHNSLYNISTVVPGQNSQKFAVGYVASRQGQPATVNWRITWDVDPGALQPSEISISGNSVFTVSGTGRTRDIVLETATINLIASQITIPGQTSRNVTNVQRRGKEDMVTLMQNFRRNHPNFTICEDFDDFPERCYEAYFSNESLAWAYSTNYKPSGVNIEYAIRER